MSTPKPTPTPKTTTTPRRRSLERIEEEYAIQSLCTLIQFETVSATGPFSGAYIACANYIQKELESISCLDYIGILNESPIDSPVIVARWKSENEGAEGADELPVILLNSHYDVVPAIKEDWTVEPFDGIRKDGKIYGRGSQDMKCVCIQYIEAIRKIHKLNPSFQPKRSIWLTFVPDEEVGGAGMAAFLSSTIYKSLPGIAIALDEGLASTSNIFSVFYGERLPWWVNIKAIGNTGHGSRFIEPTAVQQIMDISKKAIDFRNGQRDILHGVNMEKHSHCSHAVAAKKRRQRKKQQMANDNNGMMALGDVTTLNITSLEAGVKAGDGSYVYNCVPAVAKCTFDIRISPHDDPMTIKTMIDSWCKECSPKQKTTTNTNNTNNNNNKKEEYGLTWEFIGSNNNNNGEEEGVYQHALTSMNKQINPWYEVFSNVMGKNGYLISPEVFPAATDSRFLRLLGIRAIGFSPMRNCDILLHENDEYIPESTFLEGIMVYVEIIEALASQGNEMEKKEQEEAEKKKKKDEDEEEEEGEEEKKKEEDKAGDEEKKK